MKKMGFNKLQLMFISALLVIIPKKIGANDLPNKGELLPFFYDKLLIPTTTKASSEDTVESSEDLGYLTTPSEDIETRIGDKNIYETKALMCSKLTCTSKEYKGPSCACNYNTGNVVTFENECDIKRHNCRFDTAFKTILYEICPWEFKSRRGSNFQFKYIGPKYFN